MFTFLKTHPFGVKAHLERTVVLTFAAPKAALIPRIPSFLELDTFQDDWGFVAAAIVHTKDLRPAGFPVWLGTDFWLVGYRIFVRYRTAQGKHLRGLYILGSETDKLSMALLGSVFTQYNYSTKEFSFTEQGPEKHFRSSDGTTSLDYEDHMGVSVALPEGSPFTDWREARRYVGPLPFTFSHDVQRNRVIAVEGVRADWKPRPVRVIRHRFEFLHALGLNDLRLANAFVIEDVPYAWKRGVVEMLST